MSRKKAVSKADPAVERPEVDEIYEKLLVHAKLQARQMAELLASKTRPRDVLGETEYRLRGRDGQYRWFRARAVPIRGETGEVGA